MARRRRRELRSKGVTVALEGMDELEDTLLALPEDLRKGALRRGVAEGAEVIESAAKAHAPRDTGTLAESIAAVEIRRGQRPGVVRFSVGVGPEAFYAFFIEYGTSKMVAKPFMRPALIASGQRAIDAAREELRRVFAQPGMVDPS
jgi:HK97 gp10 family phage protein